ncbi:hypothetical protein Tco_0982089, partial [Tanacetum coccineum]
LKKPLHELLFEKGNLYDRVKRLRMELDEVQNPWNVMYKQFASKLWKGGSYLLASFNDAIIDEERFLKQRAKVEALRR